MGIDYAGPLWVRGEEEAKTWIVLYTCCSSRAVHLDLVPDMTTEAFLRSLQRFYSRRGIPELILSDNAGTYKAADKIIQDLMKSPEIQQWMEGKLIVWKFNIEKAPWQGGFFERMIKSIKRCLRKSLGKKSVSYEELLTLLTPL